jgi:YD repeat-containing protein
MRKPTRCLLAVTLLLLSPVVIFAQVHPNLEKGFLPDKMYEFHDIDHVNLFNGNLSLTIPLGGGTPVSDRLSLSMTLVYNSKLWDTTTKMDLTQPDPDRILKTPSARSNAGLGWMVSFGRLLEGETINPESQNDSDIVTDFMLHYESPDGSDHTFFDSMHNGSGESPDTAHWYTRDGSYIRLTGPRDPNLRLIETPDGLVREFSSYMDGTRRRWRITKIRDPFGNHIDFDYSTPRQWTITDQYQRVTTVHFKDVIGEDPTVYDDIQTYQTAIDYIDVPRFVSGTARYSFAYLNKWVVTGYCGDESGRAYQFADTNHYRLPFLSGITLPDGSTFQFEYAVGTSGNPNILPDPGDCSGGALTSVVLPTQGQISWQYQLYFMPASGCDIDAVANSAGIKTRTLHDPTSTVPDGSWSYMQELTPETQASWGCAAGHFVYDYAPSEESITMVTDPAGQKTRNHFSAWPVSRGAFNPRPDGATYDEYSLPLSHKAAAADRLISTETYDGTTLVRQTFVKYEVDSHTTEGPTFDLNRRLKASRTVFNDDSSHYIDVDSSDYDGVGHYRTTTTTGDFLGTGQTRTATTDYNRPVASVGSLIFNTGNYPGTFNRPGGFPWLLNLYDRTTTQESGVSAVQDLCFSPTTGFLNGTRTYAAGSTPQPKDLIADFGSDPAAANGVLGAVTSETYYGGDVSPLTTTAPTLCGALSGAPGTPGYDIRHTYDHGVRATSGYYVGGSTFGFKFLDQTIDPQTSLVSSSRDTAGVQTAFTYDDSRRVKTATTATDAPIAYDYANASGSIGAIVTISQASASGSGTAKAAFQFDGFGRLKLQSRTLPSTTPGVTRWTRQKTVFDFLGRKSQVSEYEESDSPAHFTVFSNFDVFGRARTVTRPDGTISTAQYAGSRRVDRSAYIHTQAGPDTPATTTELYDVHGRLYEVHESGDNLVATYTYDVANRLHTASVAGEGTVQPRTFNYDNRGFLLSETHPELGTEGTIYSMYDARGHAHHKRSGPQNSIYDLVLTYDPSERLIGVFDLNGARELKHFLYAPQNDTTVSPQSNERGKLSQAVRTNHLPAGDVVVTETYKYQFPSGRTSSRKTDVASGSTTLQSYQQDFAYDDLGEITNPGYPACPPTLPCGTTGLAGASFTYKDGSLVAIPGYASNITYLGNMLSQVFHQTGITDTYSQDPANGLPRPSAIAFAGVNGCQIPATPVITAATSVAANSTGNTASVPPDGSVQYAWSITGGSITATGASSITYTAGASGTVALSVTASNACGTSPAGTRNVPITQQLSPPINLSATTQANSSFVVLIWSQGASGSTSYRIERKDCFACPWSAIGPNPTSATTYTDTISASPGSFPVAHLYHVIAVASGSSDSAPSAPDYAVTALTLFAESIGIGTPIRGTHVQELRKAIDALRGLANLPAYWTDYSPPTEWILASHQTDMRTALDQAVFSLVTHHLTFTGTAPASGVGIAADHMNQLRAAVK